MRKEFGNLRDELGRIREENERLAALSATIDSIQRGEQVDDDDEGDDEDEHDDDDDNMEEGDVAEKEISWDNMEDQAVEYDMNIMESD